MKRQHFLFRLFSGLHILLASPPTSQASNSANIAESNTGLENAEKIHDFLIEEYKHASEYAVNILRDRTLTYNLYVIVLGALSYALVQILIAQHPATNADLIIAGLLLFYSFTNGLNFARFVTLEVNYLGSISRMDEIRQYYKQQLKPDAPDALRKIFSIEDKEFISPTKLRPTNRSACIVYTLLELGSLVAASIYLGHYWSSDWPPVFAVVLACLLACGQLFYYHKRGWR